MTTTTTTRLLHPPDSQDCRQVSRLVFQLKMIGGLTLGPGNTDQFLSSLFNQKSSLLAHRARLFVASFDLITKWTSSKSELSRSYQEAVCSRVLEFKATDKYYHQCKVSPSQAPRRGPETFEVSHPIIAIMSDPAAQTDPVRVIGDKDSLCWSIFINLMVQIFLFLSVLPDSTKRDFGINISQIYGHLDIVGFLRVCFCCA